MYGLIAKLTAAPGKRDELIAILKEGTARMPGCHSYVVAKDSSDEDILWVTEIWDSMASHDGSFTLHEVQATVERAKPLVADFQKIAVTIPVAGVD